MKKFLYIANDEKQIIQPKHENWKYDRYMVIMVIM